MTVQQLIRQAKRILRSTSIRKLGDAPGGLFEFIGKLFSLSVHRGYEGSVSFTGLDAWRSSDASI